MPSPLVMANAFYQACDHLDRLIHEAQADGQVVGALIAESRALERQAIALRHLDAEDFANAFSSRIADDDAHALAAA